MSELETARAGVFLSILALTLTWVLFSNSDDTRTAVQAQSIAVCASTHGAICDAPPSTEIPASSADIAYLGEVVVTASRLPIPLGRLVVSASRLPPDPYSRVRVAEAEGSRSIVVQ
jgi:hypothetical protein